jgi:hypothetical protein
MKTVFKLLAAIITVFILTAGFILAANAGLLNRPLKIALEYFLHAKGIEAILTDFKFKNGIISSSKTLIVTEGGQIVAHDVLIEASYKNMNIYFDARPGELAIIDSDNRSILKADYSVSINRKIFKTDNNIEFKLNKISLGNVFYNDGMLDLSYKESEKDFNLKFEFALDESTYLKTETINKQNKINITGRNVPIMFHNLLKKIIPNNSMIGFLNEFIRNGYISTLDLSIGIHNKNLTDNELYGLVKIKGVDLCYDKDFPTIKDMDFNIRINGSNVIFYVDKAYSGELLLSNGIVTMDWQGIEETILKVTANGTGPARALTDFISKQQHKDLRKGNIDLFKLEGSAKVNINIDIPLKPGTENTYNIAATIPNASLAIFNDKVKFTSTNLNGIFNGDNVTLTGSGKINDFDSDLKFVLNLKDETEFSHKLDIKTCFEALTNESTEHKKIAFLNLLEGSSVIDFKYVNKGSKGTVSVDADITNLDLYFEKLGIRKLKNDKSNIVIDGVIYDATKGKINFNLASQNGLKVNGDIILKGNQTLINIKELKNKETDLSGNISLSDDLFTASISGSTLDLSDSDMLTLLQKEKDEGHTKFKINVKKVKLKNDVWLDDLRLIFECSPTICYTGFIDSKIGAKSIEMQLTAKEEQEEWLIKCSDVGLLLRGLGMYNSMKKGNLILNLVTSRKEVQPGKIIPIHNGTFLLENFILHKAPTIIRLVSFASLPGLFSTISGNKNIGFSSMKGGFEFQDNILTINNSLAKGPYFDFTLKGQINTKDKIMDISGHVNPAYYGISPILGTIPIFGRIFTGNKNQRGIVSKSYKLKDSY